MQGRRAGGRALHRAPCAHAETPFRGTLPCEAGRRAPRRRISSRRKGWSTRHAVTQRKSELAALTRAPPSCSRATPRDHPRAMRSATRAGHEGELAAAGGQSEERCAATRTTRTRARWRTGAQPRPYRAAALSPACEQPAPWSATGPWARPTPSQICTPRRAGRYAARSRTAASALRLRGRGEAMSIKVQPPRSRRTAHAAAVRWLGGRQRGTRNEAPHTHAARPSTSERGHAHRVTGGLAIWRGSICCARADRFASAANDARRVRPRRRKIPPPRHRHDRRARGRHPGAGNVHQLSKQTRAGQSASAAMAPPALCAHLRQSAFQKSQ